MSLNQSGVDFSVRKSSNGLEYDNNGNEELLFLVKDTQVDVTIGDVM